MNRLQRTSKVARTAHDLDHSNRLVLPEFGVVEVWLEAGDKRSKSHLMRGARSARTPSEKGGDFWFAPGPQLDEETWKEEPSKRDEIKIVYDLHNPCFAIEEATLELFQRFTSKPIWSRKLVGEELLDGKHELLFHEKPSWDGRIGPQDGFPDEYVTAERSPYKLKLTVKGAGRCESPIAWTYFHVLVAKLELEWGPENVLPKPRAHEADHWRVLRELITQFPAPPQDKTAKVKLLSNVFKTTYAQMLDNTGFEQYQAYWGDGPRIPLFLKVWLKNAAGDPVLAPRGLGGLRFLWDWESRFALGEDTFINQSEQYHTQATRPKGHNCHHDRGGKRGSPDKRVFPVEAGYAPKDKMDRDTFPFQVEACPAPRSWAALSRAWTKGELASKTGVIFQPARQAGDVYRVAVYVAQEVRKDGSLRLNTDADAPLPVQPELKATASAFTTWREVHISKYRRKSASATAMDLALICEYYKSAFIELVDLTGGVKDIPAATWNQSFRDHVKTWGPEKRLTIDPAIDQYAEGPMGAYFRTLDQWKEALAAAKDGWKVDDASTWLAAHGINREDDFRRLCDDMAETILTAICDDMLSNNEGITILQSDSLHNRNPGISAMAVNCPQGAGRRAGFILVRASDEWGGTSGGGVDTAEATSAHEIGHHLFLPHTPESAECKDYHAHDKLEAAGCVMSYNQATRVTAFCGFCCLRMRGWSKQALSDQGENNSRP